MLPATRIKAHAVSVAAALLCFFLPVLVFVPPLFCSDAAIDVIAPAQPFGPGETLKYEVSWSKTLKAGTAVMEVTEKMLPDGKQVLAFILSGRSAGLVDRLFRVNHRIQSVFDPGTMQSLAYTSMESVGKKKRRRSLVFDHTQNIVVGTLNDEPPQTHDVPARVQDGLSSLYFLRTRNDFTPGNVFVVDVHESGKNWSIEVHTLGREKVRTPAGEFSTIKVKTRPLFEGVFRNKGEVFIWLTDDSRKVPVLMKSTIRMGSFVFTLKDMKPGAAVFPPSVHTPREIPEKNEVLS